MPGAWGKILELLLRLWDFFALKKRQRREEEILNEYEQLEESPHDWFKSEFGGVQPPGEGESESKSSPDSASKTDS